MTRGIRTRCNRSDKFAAIAPRVRAIEDNQKLDIGPPVSGGPESNNLVQYHFSGHSFRNSSSPRLKFIGHIRTVILSVSLEGFGEIPPRDQTS